MCAAFRPVASFLAVAARAGVDTAGFGRRANGRRTQGNAGNAGRRVNFGRTSALPGAELNRQTPGSACRSQLPLPRTLPPSGRWVPPTSSASRNLLFEYMRYRRWVDSCPS